MAIDYPASPVLNQIFTAAGASWRWDGTKWVVSGTGSGGSITIGDTPPASPTAGSGWWDSTDGQLFIWYVDPVGPGQWVPATNQSGVFPVPLPIAQGGTNAATAPAALTSLGAVAKAGDTMTGALTVSSGNITTTTGSFVMAATGGLFNGANAVIKGAAVGGYTVVCDNTGFNSISLGPSGDQSNYYDQGAHLFRSRASAQWMQINSIGTYNVSGSWLTLSDPLLKEDVTAYTRGLEALCQLNPVTFRYVAGSPFAAPEPRDPLIGLLADEVEPHMPELVGEYTDDKGHTVATLAPGNLVYALINAVKELTARLEAVEAKL